MDDAGSQRGADSGSKETVLKQRRTFLKDAGKVAVTAPAVGLLLSMQSKRASADATVAPSGLQFDAFAAPPD